MNETKKQPSEDYARERLASSPLSKLWQELELLKQLKDKES